MGDTTAVSDTPFDLPVSVFSIGGPPGIALADGSLDRVVGVPLSAGIAGQYRGRGRFADDLFGERVYVVLSLTAKGALAWQIFANTLIWRPRRVRHFVVGLTASIRGRRRRA